MFEGSEYGPRYPHTPYLIATPSSEQPKSMHPIFTSALHCDSRLPLLLIRLPAKGNPLQNLLPILIRLDLGDLELGGCDADGDALAVALLASHALDVHDVFEAVD